MPAMNGDNGHRQMIQMAESLARQHMDNYQDVSHDWLHVQRVRTLALSIAQSIGVSQPIDMLVVELAALFHDLHDSKYSAATANIYEDLHDRFFAEHLRDGSISQEQAELVARICDNVSYSKEARRIANGGQTEWHSTCLELHCVQDADKLDAMGAIGILRCAAYSAAKKRPLVDTTDGQGDAIQHFHDKLLKLNDMLKTEKGRKLGASRHQLMLDFIKQAEVEATQLEE